MIQFIQMALRCDTDAAAIEHSLVASGTASITITAVASIDPQRPAFSLSMERSL